MTKKYLYIILLFLGYQHTTKSVTINDQLPLNQLQIYVQKIQDINYGIQLYDITVDAKDYARELWNHLRQYSYFILEQQKQKNTHLDLLQDITQKTCVNISSLVKTVNFIRLSPSVTQPCIQKIICLQKKCEAFRVQQRAIKKRLYYHAMLEFFTQGALLGLMIGTPLYTAKFLLKKCYEYASYQDIPDSALDLKSQVGICALVGLCYSVLIEHLYQYGKKTLEIHYSKIQNFIKTWQNFNQLIEIMDAANALVQKIEDQAALIQKNLENVPN